MHALPLSKFSHSLPLTFQSNGRCMLCVERCSDVNDRLSNLASVVRLEP
jgi:hypothetical protein